MKITKAHLKQIIKEEVVKLLVEQDEYDYDYDDEEELTPAQKIIKLLSSTEPDYVDQGFTILDDLGDQQLIDTIASYIDFDPTSASITTQGFDLPQEIVPQQLGMILNYFAKKSVHVKNMLAQIENLDITDEFMTNVDFLSFCMNLKGLNLNWCTSLENVDGLQGLTNLTYLELGACESLQNVDGLKGCTKLRSLDLSWCRSLQNIDGLKECTNLTTLDLSMCYSLPSELQRWFKTDSRGTAHEKFMKALNTSKTSQP